VAETRLDRRDLVPVTAAGVSGSMDERQWVRCSASTETPGAAIPRILIWSALLRKPTAGSA